MAWVCSSASCPWAGRLLVGSGLVLRLERGEREKGIWWMPWRREAMKDVARCEKPGGEASAL